jgi:hypothetical protein
MIGYQLMVKQEGSELEGDKISVKTKTCLADWVSISERKNININIISVDEGLKSLYWCINNRRGKLIEK